MKRCAERTELKTEFKLFKLYGIKKNISSLQTESYLLKENDKFVKFLKK